MSSQLCSQLLFQLCLFPLSSHFGLEQGGPAKPHQEEPLVPGSAVPGTRASPDIGGEKPRIGSNAPVTPGRASALQSNARQIKAPSPASTRIFRHRAQALPKQPDPSHRWQTSCFSLLETEPSLLFSSPSPPRCTPALPLSGKGQSTAPGDELPALWPEFTFLPSPAMRIGA